MVDCEGWTFKAVEERLVEAMRLWWRSPGDGRWPFASDGPWHLISGEAGDYDARGGDGTSSDVPLRPLSVGQAEMARRDEASEWIGRYVAGPDRRLVQMALVHLASGRKAVPWKALRDKMGAQLGAGGLGRRYRKAIKNICEALNAAETRR